MSTIVRKYSYVDSKVARASHANENEETLYNEINGCLNFENIKAALVNAANGFLKLDTDGLVDNDQIPLLELAKIPDTLTGKDADTLDTKHYTDITAKIAADIATHAAIAAVHHAKTVSGDIDHGSVGGLGDDDHPQYLKKAGGIMTGALTLHGAPTSNLHASTKKYVDDLAAEAGIGDMLKAVYDADGDDKVDNAEKLEGSTKAQVRDHTPKSHKLNSHSAPDGFVNMGLQRLVNLADPTLGPDATHKKYVDDKETIIKEYADTKDADVIAPDYDSGWVAGTVGGNLNFAHNLDTLDLIYQFWYRIADNIRHVATAGATFDDAHLVDSNTIRLENFAGSEREYRVLLWEF